MTGLDDLDDIYTTLVFTPAIPTLGLFSSAGIGLRWQSLAHHNFVNMTNDAFEVIGLVSPLQTIPTRLPEEVKGMVMPLLHTLSAMFFMVDLGLDLVEDFFLLPFRFVDMHQHKFLNATLPLLSALVGFPAANSPSYILTVDSDQLRMADDGELAFREDGGLTTSHNPLWLCQLLINRVRGGPQRVDWLLHEAHRERNHAVSWRPTWGPFGGAKAAGWMVEEDGTGRTPLKGGQFDDGDRSSEWLRWQQESDEAGEQEDEESVYGPSWGEEWSAAKLARAHPRFVVTALENKDIAAMNFTAATVRSLYSTSPQDFFHPRVAARGLYAHVSDENILGCFEREGGLLAIGFGSTQSYECTSSAPKLEHATVNLEYLSIGAQDARGCNVCDACCNIDLTDGLTCEACAVSRCGLPSVETDPVRVSNRIKMLLMAHFEGDYESGTPLSAVLDDTFLVGQHRSAMDTCLMAAPSHQLHRSNLTTQKNSTFRVSWRTRFLNAEKNPRVQSFLAGCANESSKVVYSVKNIQGGWEGDTKDPAKQCKEHRMQLLEQMYEAISDVDLTECYDFKLSADKNSHASYRASEAMLVGAIDDCLRASPSLALYHARVRANPALDASTGGHIRFVDAAFYADEVGGDGLSRLSEQREDSAGEDTVDGDSVGGGSAGTNETAPAFSAEEGGDSGANTTENTTAFNAAKFENHSAELNRRGALLEVLKQQNPSAVVIPYTGMHAGRSYLASGVVGNPTLYEYSRSSKPYVTASDLSLKVEELDSLSVDELQEISAAMGVLHPIAGDRQQRQVWVDAISDAIELRKAKLTPVVTPAEQFVEVYGEAVEEVDVDSLETKLAKLRRTTRTEYLSIMQLLDAKSAPMVLVALSALDKLQMWLVESPHLAWLAEKGARRGVGYPSLVSEVNKASEAVLNGDEKVPPWVDAAREGDGSASEDTGELLVLTFCEHVLLEGADLWDKVRAFLLRRGRHLFQSPAAKIALFPSSFVLTEQLISMSDGLADQIIRMFRRAVGWPVFGTTGYSGERDALNQPHGVGTMVWADTFAGPIAFVEGTWADTTGTGSHRREWEDDSTAVTMCTRVLAKGRAAQPCKYEGEWVHGRRHGFGKEWYADGSTKEVSSGWRGGSPDPAGTTFVRYAGDRSLYVEVGTAAFMEGTSVYVGAAGAGAAAFAAGAVQPNIGKFTAAAIAKGNYGTAVEEAQAYRAAWVEAHGLRRASSKDQTAYALMIQARRGGRMVGSRYEGGRDEEGRAHGHGVEKDAAGGMYDGGWKAGTRDGHGRWRHTNGAGYEGGWRDGLKHGEGFAKFDDGSSYNGTWHQGEYEGQGEYRWSNGNWYRGGWNSSKKHGEGEFHSHAQMLAAGVARVSGPYPGKAAAASAAEMQAAMTASEHAAQHAKELDAMAENQDAAGGGAAAAGGGGGAGAAVGAVAGAVGEAGAGAGGAGAGGAAAAGAGAAGAGAAGAGAAEGGVPRRPALSLHSAWFKGQYTQGVRHGTGATYFHFSTAPPLAPGVLPVSTTVAAVVAGGAVFGAAAGAVVGASPRGMAAAAATSAIGGAAGAVAAAAVGAGEGGGATVAGAEAVAAAGAAAGVGGAAVVTAEMWIEGLWTAGRKEPYGTIDAATGEALAVIVHGRANKVDGTPVTMRFEWQAEYLAQMGNPPDLATGEISAGSNAKTEPFKIPQLLLAAKIYDVGVSHRDALVLARAVGRWSLAPAARPEAEHALRDMQGGASAAEKERAKSKARAKEKGRARWRERNAAAADAGASAGAEPKEMGADTAGSASSTEGGEQGGSSQQVVDVIEWEPDFDFDFELGEDSNGKRVYVPPATNGWGVYHFRNYTAVHEGTGARIISGEGSIPQLLLLVASFHTLLVLALCIQCRVASVRITLEAVSQEFLATGGPFVLYVIYLKTDEWMVGTGVDAARPLVQVHFRSANTCYLLCCLLLLHSVLLHPCYCHF
jgi:hypothetical protein